MQIQNNSALNFNANLVTKATRYYNSGRIPKAEVIEVFKLDESDISFAEKCLNVLGKYHRRDLLYLQKRIKSFFKSFHDDEKTRTYDFYLAVKDNKEISGGIMSFPLGKKVFVMDVFSQCPKSYNLDVLTEAFLSSADSIYPGYAIETNKMLDRFKDGQTEISSSAIQKIRHQMHKLYSSTIFEKSKGENTTLDAVLGTGNLELEVNPHLLK